MKARTLLTIGMAALALAACKAKDSATSATAANETVTITQANPPPGGTWADVVNATGAGGYLMGNPNAEVKLVEIGALTCPHCREFDEAAMPTLIEKYVKPGQVSYEFRPYLLNGLDIPANLIASCNGIKTFFPIARALFHDQQQWLGKVQTVPPERLEQIQSLPPTQQFAELAKLAGLQEWAAARGVSQANSDQCLRDQAKIDKLVAQTSNVTQQFPEFEGTPSFILNGTLLPREASTWKTLQPRLDEALKS